MSKEPIEPGRAQPTYSGFLILRINEIWGIWRDGDPEQALRLGIRLANTFLIRKIKKELKHDIEVITKDMNKAYGLQGVDFFTTHLVRNRQAQRVANHYIEPFLSKMSDLVDQWGFYELPSRRLKASDFKELEKDED